LASFRAAVALKTGLQLKTCGGGAENRFAIENLEVLAVLGAAPRYLCRPFDHAGE
jgi:hypothetical protein